MIFALKDIEDPLYIGTKCTVFTDHKSLQHIIDQKELNMRQRHWLELLSDYDCDIRYHPGKANIVANALSQLQIDAHKLENLVNEDVGSMIIKDIPRERLETSARTETLWLHAGVGYPSSRDFKISIMQRLSKV
ncbi:putative reverse transcriptase domain-containing protein [Tanacetum coccineum]